MTYLAAATHPSEDDMLTSSYFRRQTRRCSLLISLGNYLACDCLKIDATTPVKTPWLRLQLAATIAIRAEYALTQ